MPKPKNILLLALTVYLVNWCIFLWGTSVKAWYTATGNSYFHLAGGLLIGLLIASYYSSQLNKLSQLLKFFCVLGMVIGVGVLWEFHEYVLNNLFGRGFQGDLSDTILDLLLDTIGGMIAGLYFIRRGNSK